MTPHPADRYALPAAIVLACAAVACLARADAPRPFHVLVAATCANESTRVLRPLHDHGTDGEPDADCVAIAQTVREWAKWRHTSEVAAIKALAPHVAGGREPMTARHRAFGSLPARGSARPAAWDESVFGSWRVYGPCWVKLRERVARMLAGPIHPCDGEPIAWGNEQDAVIALGRGLVRVDCGQTANAFWQLPPRGAVSAREASGR